MTGALQGGRWVAKAARDRGRDVRSPTGGLAPSAPFRVPGDLGELVRQDRVGEFDHCGQKIREGGRELIATVPAPPRGKAACATVSYPSRIPFSGASPTPRCSATVLIAPRSPSTVT